jgi:pimeloyl-ACP methyl ester carboxylesterase
MSGRQLGDIVVLLPGITGSILSKDGKDVWAFSGGALARGLFSLGGSVKELALVEDPSDVDDLGDGVTATRLIGDVHLIPGLWKIDGYSKIAITLQSAFDLTRGQNFFEFAYDWRRDNRVAARRLARQSQAWLRAWREASSNRDAKLILVGHSMGGLVARYFLECLDGWRDTRLLLTFGTPYRGSLNALRFLYEGFRKRLGPLTVADLSDLLRSFTSVYQLLPVYPCVDRGTGELARVSELRDIPGLDPDRAVAALDFHREIREAAQEHADDNDYRVNGYTIHPMVGMFQPTLQSARLTGTQLEFLRTYQEKDQDGDGTVPRVSATPLELGNRPDAMYASERHASLQNFDPVLVQLTSILRGLRIDLSAFYAVNTRLALDVDDIYAAGEPVELRVRPENEGMDLIATVAEVDGGQVVAQERLPQGDGGWRELRLPPFAPGVYRVRVSGDFAVDPVTDIFTVAGSVA